jgi:hypothetical protein
MSQISTRDEPLLKSVTNVAKQVRRRLGEALGISNRQVPFTTSAEYWEQRYRVGGNSGAGSYGRLAEFKAEFLNRFVKDHAIGSVIEFGSGDGAQLALAEYPAYIGVDISPTAVEHCRSIYRDRSGFQFIHTSEYQPGTQADLSLSLDVIYHLVEDEAFGAYMAQLFNSALRFVIIYSSNDDARPSSHVRHRRFTPWVESNAPEFSLIAVEPNPFPFEPSDPQNTSPADFYVYAREGS